MHTGDKVCGTPFHRIHSRAPGWVAVGWIAQPGKTNCLGTIPPVSETQQLPAASRPRFSWGPAAKDSTPRLR